MESRSSPTTQADRGTPPKGSAPAAQEQNHLNNNINNNAGLAVSPAATTPTSAPSGNGRRKANGTSSRGVASLTPEQLERKRANDRQAQRAIRERTKAQIESLRRQVQELTSQQPYRDMQRLIAEKEAIRAENEEIKRQLQAVLEIIQPILKNGIDSSRLTSVTTPGPVQPTYPSPAADRTRGTPPSIDSGPMSDAERSVVTEQPSPAHTIPAVPMTPAAAAAAAAAGPTTPAAAAAAATATSARPWNRYDTDSDPLRTFGITPTQPPRCSDRNGGEKLIFNFLVEDSRPFAKVPPGCLLRDEAHSSVANESLDTCTCTSHCSSNCACNNSSCNASRSDPPEAYMIPIRNLPPTCTLDAIFLDFFQHRRHEAAAGMSAALSPLLNPSSLPDHHRGGHASSPPPAYYSISKVATDLLRTFPDISTLPEQVGVLYIMYVVMRWQIYPTRDNYDRLPDWITPRPSQLFTPHPAWMDYVLWPRARDRMIAAHTLYPFENWFIPYTRTLSCNWPFSPTECILHRTDTDELVLNPVFEKHIRDLNNWSLGPAFAQSFPALADAVRIRL